MRSYEELQVLALFPTWPGPALPGSSDLQTHSNSMQFPTSASQSAEYRGFVMNLCTFLWPWNLPGFNPSVWQLSCQYSVTKVLATSLLHFHQAPPTRLTWLKSQKKIHLQRSALWAVWLLPDKFPLWRSLKPKSFLYRLLVFESCEPDVCFVCLWCQGMVKIYWITSGFSKRLLLFALVRNERSKYNSWYSTARTVQCNRIRKNRRCDEKIIKTLRSALQISGDLLTQKLRSRMQGLSRIASYMLSH